MPKPKALRFDQAFLAEIPEVQVEVPRDAFRCGDLLMIPSRCLVAWKGYEISLSQRQREIVETLARHPEVALTVDRMWEVWFDDSGAEHPSCHTSEIKRIRQAFRAADPSFAQIGTRYQIGYYWKAPVGRRALMQEKTNDRA